MVFTIYDDSNTNDAEFIISVIKENYNKIKIQVSSVLCERNVPVIQVFIVIEFAILETKNRPK